MVEVDARTAVGGGHLCSSDWGAPRGASHENYGKAPLGSTAAPRELVAKARVATAERRENILNEL